MPPSLLLYSIYYKPFPLVPAQPYIRPIQAGAAVHPQLPIPGDDTGNTISHRNQYYSELTAAYWIWKNAERETEAWGLCHYRRYLIPVVKKYYFKEKSRCYFKTSQSVLDSILTHQLYCYLQELLCTYDVIVQRPTHPKKVGHKVFTVKDGYYTDHIKKHWDVMMEVVIEKYPDYTRSIEKFGAAKHMFFNNIMIAKWSIWDDYLSWLFSILFQVEERIELPGKGYQERVFGFMAERLHNLYIYHNDLKPAYLTLGLFED